MNWAVIGPLIDQLLRAADAEVTLCNCDSETYKGEKVVYVSNAATKWEQRSFRGATVEEALRTALTVYGMWELI